MAGRHERRNLTRILDETVASLLGEHAKDITWKTEVTAVDRDAETIAREALRSGSDLVVAVGGDGTLHGVVNALAGSEVVVGLVPMGTGNDFARAVGVPLSFERALNLINSGHIRQIDVGRHGPRRFINVAGCGFDAEVAERVNARRWRTRGRLAYLMAVVQTLVHFRPSVLQVFGDGGDFCGHAMLCAVANGISYGAGMRIAPGARVNDGLLNVCIVRACSKLEFIRSFPRVFRGTHVDHPKVVTFASEVVHVDSDPPVRVLVDGELAGWTPASFTVEAGALRFLAP